MYQRKNEQLYTRESTARQLAPNQTTTKQPVKRKKKKRTINLFIKDIREGHSNHIMSYLILAAVVGGAIILLTLQANYTYARNQIESLSTQLATITHQNNIRETEIYTNLDMAQIEYIAVNQLDMAQPEPFQLVDVLIEPRSFMTHTGVDMPVQTSSFSFSRLWEILFGD